MQQSFPSKDLPPDAAAILKQNGIDPSAAKSGDVQKILSGMRPDQAQKLNQLLQNKEAVDQLLRSPKAQEMITRLFGNNGAK